MLLTLLLSLAYAGVPEDLEVAANKDLPSTMRREAMDRLQRAESFDMVLTQAQDNTVPAPRRWVAVRALGKSTANGSREALIALLSSTDAPIRMAACLSMAERDDPTLTGRVAARLEDPAILVRWAAADALGTMKQAAALPDLGRALADGSNSRHGDSLFIRRHFVEAITAIGTEEALPHLAKVLEDRDPAVAAAALVGLEKVAGVSFKAGRTPAEEKEAWRRWASARTKY